MSQIKPLSILIVEDDADVREVSSWMLQAEGFHVESAADAQEAWTLLQQGCAEVVLSDVNMPGVSGVELALRVTSAFPQIPVILTSGCEQPSLASAKSTTCYLPKPFDRASLIKAIYSAANDAA